MPFPPLYLVVNWKNTGANARGNRFTGEHRRDNLWKVGLVAGYYPGQTLNFFFESEAEAGHFAPWQIYDPRHILQASDPSRQYTVQNVVKYMWPVLNALDLTPVEIPVWTVQFVDYHARNFLDWQFPVEQQARRFNKGFSYRLQDLFGTTRALPADISAALQAAALQAQAAQQALQNLKGQSNEAAQEAGQQQISDQQAAVDAAIAAAQKAENDAIAAANLDLSKLQADVAHTQANADAMPREATLAAALADITNANLQKNLAITDQKTLATLAAQWPNSATIQAELAESLDLVNQAKNIAAAAASYTSALNQTQIDLNAANNYDVQTRSYEAAVAGAQSAAALTANNNAAQTAANNSFSYSQLVAGIAGSNPTITSLQNAATAAHAAAVDAFNYAVMAAHLAGRAGSLEISGAEVGFQINTQWTQYGTVGRVFDYYIVNGGSGGWYHPGALAVAIGLTPTAAQLTAAGFVFHAPGSFTLPFNGFFKGFIVNESSVGSINGVAQIESTTVGFY